MTIIPQVLLSTDFMPGAVLNVKIEQWGTTKSYPPNTDILMEKQIINKISSNKCYKENATEWWHSEVMEMESPKEKSLKRRCQIWVEAPNEKNEERSISKGASPKRDEQVHQEAKSDQKLCLFNGEKQDLGSGRQGRRIRQRQAQDELCSSRKDSEWTLFPV